MANVSVSVVVKKSHGGQLEDTADFVIGTSAPGAGILEIRLDDTKWTSYRELENEIKEAIKALRLRGNLGDIN